MTPKKENGKPYRAGLPVNKRKGYKFPGIIVAVYFTLKGELRYVVECTQEGVEGCQHIFSHEQLEPAIQIVQTTAPVNIIQRDPNGE